MKTRRKWHGTEGADAEMYEAAYEHSRHQQGCLAPGHDAPCTCGVVSRKYLFGEAYAEARQREVPELAEKLGKAKRALTEVLALCAEAMNRANKSGKRKYDIKAELSEYLELLETMEP